MRISFHCYRHDGLGPLYRNAWVNSQGESTDFAKRYAEEKPAKLGIDLKHILDLKVKTKEALSELDKKSVQKLKKLVQEGPSKNPQSFNLDKIVVTKENGRNGVFALIKRSLPTLFINPDLVQLAYKWTFALSHGAVNFIKEGDVVSMKTGRLTVERAGRKVLDDLEFLPWSLFQEKLTSEPVVPAPEPVAPDKAAADKVAADKVAADKAAADKAAADKAAADKAAADKVAADKVAADKAAADKVAADKAAADKAAADKAAADKAAPDPEQVRQQGDLLLRMNATEIMDKVSSTSEPTPLELAAWEAAVPKLNLEQIRAVLSVMSVNYPEPLQTKLRERMAELN